MKRIGNAFLTFTALTLSVIILGCGNTGGVNTSNTSYDGKSAKYVFFFIGDGMAAPQTLATEAFLGSKAKTGNLKRLSFTQFPAQGISTTHSVGSYITDSAAAATALAAGKKTRSGVVSMDESGKKKYPSMAEMAKAKGMKVGIVSSVSIDHATPACFYAHQPTRKNYYEIGVELAKSGFDYFGGGGLAKPKGQKKDKKDAYEIAKEEGYTIVTEKDEFLSLTKSAGKVFAHNKKLDGAALYYDIDCDESHISLAEFTKKGIELLDNENGFFLMVEGGKIDWACHANDAAAAIKDTIAFNDAVMEAVAFMKKHPNETLIVVTGDHECGGLSVGAAVHNASTALELIDAQRESHIPFNKKLVEMKKKEGLTLNDILPLIEKTFGLKAEGEGGLVLTTHEMKQIKDAFTYSTTEYTGSIKRSDPNYRLYGYAVDPVTTTLLHIFNEKAGLAWTSYYHTAVPVPTYATGVGAGLFNGGYDNTDIAKNIMKVMGVDASVMNETSREATLATR